MNRDKYQEWVSIPGLTTIDWRAPLGPLRRKGVRGAVAAVMARLRSGG